ncbi:hypothetical protein ACWT_2659 [Actinoplanes sp. SE50]|uniref:tetratricopeptide repeat protein n=1 Tax=unclassified Actinoplanes TaxID=2626549 RepID=UPI00023ECC92|nr:MULTISPECIES: tetratricopeptide repeat protein [unclassified Actinoplanes]AEV83782.1 hypothetical protein ACPL_2887 [Actinoplanes sp. SE50/110]ATO82074.1 hypothetical protein ACWT_2659 [Actinoplanes sp. SE50]SLL99482.1 hypothetical protein ACSP50_2713 [Actinoplanes sp. SE50/110]
MAEIYRSAAAENERGEVLRRAGRPAEATEHFSRALAALLTSSDPDPATHAAILDNLALVAHERGDLAEAKRHLVRSLQVGPLVGDPVGRAITYDNLGVVEVELARAGHGRREAHLGEAERHFAAAERLFRSVLPDAVDDYLRSVLNRADAAELRGDLDRVDRLSRHAAEVAAHHAIAPENALEAVTMRGGFLHQRRNRPRVAVELLTARLPALLPGCPPASSMAALAVLLRAATATGDPVLIEDVTARITELGEPGTSKAKIMARR